MVIGQWSFYEYPKCEKYELDFETRRVEMIIEFIGINDPKPRSGEIILSCFRHFIQN
jgi:hypothetical protein